ncbi:CDP-glycerol glycerophosphotransferase family protein [Oceanobacillus caeni]
MVRELSITIYLFMFRVIFNICKLFPKEKKIVAVASFGDNIMYTARALKQLDDQKIIVLKDEKCKYELDSTIDQTFDFKVKKPFDFIKSIYHLATASTVLIDNYQGFLAVTEFRPGVRCIQLWHAAGSLKRFGLEDPTNEARTSKAMERFKQVYSRFHYTIVGSEKMVETFQRSFDLSDERFIRTGIPRSDILFNEQVKHDVYGELIEKHPMIKGKKIILYAPTFRHEQLENYQLELDLKQLYRDLSDDYVLFIKLHPAVSNLVNYEQYEGFVYDVSYFTETNALLLVTDILISDYSSIPFEYALLEKPMIFFAYDMDEYKITNGLIHDYETQMPGPVVFTTFEIIRTIKEDDFDLGQVRAFSDEWNEYSTGNASMNLARFITGVEEEEKEREEVSV